MARSRRTENLAGLVGLAIALGAAGWLFLGLPEGPRAPRYVGAGAEGPRRGGTLRIHHEAAVRSLDPLVSFDVVSTSAIKLLFEGLLDYDLDTLALVPRLAEEVPRPSADGLRYRFRLRRGLRFADSEVFEGGRGREITAHDVRWSLERMLHPDTASPGVSFFLAIDGLDAYREGEAEHVRGIVVIDRYTVEIRLSQPDHAFLYAMAMGFAYPVARETYARWGDQASRHPVSTGAFVLESWEPSVALTFARNPNYFVPGRPYLDRVVFWPELGRRAAMMRFMNGDLEHAHRQTPADYLRVMAMDAWAPYRRELAEPRIWGLAMNCEMPPLDDRHFRRGLAFALNGPRWRRARAGRARLTGQPVPPGVPGHVSDLAGAHRYDLAQARREMALAGFGDGYPEELTLWMSAGDTGRFYGELIQQDLLAVGVRVRIRQLSFPTWLSMAGRRRTMELHLDGWRMDYPDPSSFLDSLFHSRAATDRDATNKAFYANPEVDRLLDEARRTTDRARRMALYRRASEIIVDDAPWGFVFADTSLELWQPYVRGYRPNPVWPLLMRDVWLDLPRRRAPSAHRVPALSWPFVGNIRGRP